MVLLQATVSAAGLLSGLVFVPLMVLSPVLKGDSGVSDSCNNPLPNWGVSGEEKGSDFTFDGSDTEGDGVPVRWLSLLALSIPNVRTKITRAT